MGQLVADQVIEQEAELGLVGAGREVPRAGRLADGVPGPHGARLHGFGIARHAAYLAPHRLDPDPAAVVYALGPRDPRIDEQIVVRVDLAQPGVLRIPGMVHGHRALGDGVQRVLVDVGHLRFERLVVERQRIEIGFDALRQVRRRAPLRRPPALRRHAELLQHFGVDLDHDRVGVAAQARPLRPLVIALVPVAHVLVGRRQLLLEHAIVLGVHLPLPRIGFALHELLAALAAPAGEEADARTGLGLVVDDEIGVVAVLAAAVGVDESGKLQAAGELDQHFLERLARTRRRQHRHAHRVHRTVEF